MIRFKYGPNRSGSAAHETSTATSASGQPAEAKTASTLEFFETPTRYRRRPLTQEEIDLVTVRRRLLSIIRPMNFAFFFRSVEQFNSLSRARAPIPALDVHINGNEIYSLVSKWSRFLTRE